MSRRVATSIVEGYATNKILYPRQGLGCIHVLVPWVITEAPEFAIDGIDAVLQED